MTAAALSVNDLRVELASGARVVDDVAFDVPPGRTLGLVGESGCGKTTTGLALLGFARRGMRITDGEVVIAGKRMPIGDERAARRLRGRLVAHVPQEPAGSLNPSLRVEDALADIVRAHCAAKPVAHVVVEALEQVNLPTSRDFRRRFPHELSGGQQQRVLIAAALVARPPLIVLDEPTTGLDTVTQARIVDEIVRLASEQGIAMVYVSHDLAVVSAIADRVAVMYGGRIVEEGPTERILHRPLHPYTSGLIAAVPDHLAPRRLHGIPGVAVGAIGHPPGCSFEPRCAQRVQRCGSSMPTLEEVAPGHLVRCFEWGRTPLVQRSAEPLAPPSGRRETLLSVERLRAVHHGPQPVVAAEDVSFSVGAHECVGLVGESGSGKTTIARCVAGLHAPAFGQIALGGRPLAARARDRSREERRRCQIVFQDPYESLNPRRRIADEIARAGAVLRGLRRAEARAETARLLDLVRLPSRLADRFPGELSGGERQRVAIARAAIALPDLIVCDEITSALDVSVQAAVIELLAELRATFGLALLLITHDLGVVASIADRVLVLEQGRICEEGPVERVFAFAQHPRSRELVAAAPRLERRTGRG